MTLEEEFLYYAAIHRFSILKAMMIKYYSTLEADSINLPDFQREDSPEKLADKDVKNLVLTDINKFNSLYEKAWAELAPLLE